MEHVFNQYLLTVVKYTIHPYFEPRSILKAFVVYLRKFTFPAWISIFFLESDHNIPEIPKNGEKPQQIKLGSVKILVWALVSPSLTPICVINILKE